MSIRFQADNDLNRLLVTATVRAEAAIDFQSAQAAQLDGIGDPDVLLPCAAGNRVLVTHDKRTMPRHFADFVTSVGQSPRLILVIPQQAQVARVVECLVLIWADNRPEDWANRITYIPF